MSRVNELAPRGLSPPLLAHKGSLVANVEAHFDNFHILFKELCQRLARDQEAEIAQGTAEFENDLRGNAYQSGHDQEPSISGMSIAPVPAPANATRLHSRISGMPLHLPVNDHNSEVKDRISVGFEDSTAETSPGKVIIGNRTSEMSDETPSMEHYDTTRSSLSGADDFCGHQPSSRVEPRKSAIAGRSRSERQSMRVSYRLPSFQSIQSGSEMVQSDIRTFSRESVASGRSSYLTFSKEGQQRRPAASLRQLNKKSAQQDRDTRLTQMTSYSAGTDLTDLGMQKGAFEVNDMWTRTLQMDSVALSRDNHFLEKRSEQINDNEGMATFTEASLHTLSDGDTPKPAKRWCPCCPRRCLLTPNSPPRLMWDVLGIVFMVHDLIWIPLLMCNAPEGGVSKVFTWILRIYWTLDIPGTFMTGFINSDGDPVVDTSKVAGRYCRTWLIFDVFLVAIDWIEIIVTQAMGLLRSARFGKVLRTLRVIRMIRLARLAKLPGIMNRFFERIFAESTVLAMSITKIIVLFLGFNHVVACIWFKLASDNFQEVANWLEGHGYSHGDITELTYSVSMHWAVTCFIGNMEVQVYNLSERVFAIAVLIVSFVASASFVSAITTSITRLQIINGQEQTHFSLLRTFLRAQGINAKLALRITKSAKSALTAQKNQVGEDDVELLKLVPGPLKVEMHYEIHSRVLEYHALFKLYCSVNPLAMRRVCHDAISIISVTRSEVLFRKGARPDPPSMLFLTHGSLGYFKEDRVTFGGGQPKASIMTEGQYAVEATLWLSNWVHRGKLLGATDSTVLRLHADVFQEIMGEEFDPLDEDHPAWYAVWFSNHMCEVEAKRITDLDMDLDHTALHDRQRDLERLDKDAKANFRSFYRDSVTRGDDSRSLSLMMIGSTVRNSNESNESLQVGTSSEDAEEQATWK